MSRIIKRAYYEIVVKLVSPLSVSSGVGESTDSDVLRNGNGSVFVPGSSLTGAFRRYAEQRKKAPGLFGFSDNDEGKMSSIWISDLYFDSRAVVSERDNVKLTEERIAERGAKFDTEIIESGAKGRFHVEYILREGEPDLSETISQILYGIDNGEIRFGSKKTRGFGQMKVLSVAEKMFSEADVSKWIQFCENNLYGEAIAFDEWLKNKEIRNKYVSISVPLKLSGGISIRRYSTRAGEADYEHLTCNSKPVIPGSSWAGAIRSDAVRILKEIGWDKDKANEQIEKWFGAVEKKVADDKKESWQSLITIGESVLEGSIPVPYTRTRISRFSGAAVSGLLYSEVAYYGGNTSLEILIKAKETDNVEPLLGLLNIVINDIKNGYLPIGGLVSIGRGVFEEGETATSYSGIKVDEEKWLKALASLRSGGNNSEN